MNKQAPPLKIWAWVGFVFILSQALILVFYDYKKLDVQNGELYYPKKSTIQEEFNDEQSIKVVFIGSSLIGFGVACPEDIRALQTSKSAQEIQLVKYWGSFDPFERLVKHGLIEDLKELKPDLVLLQTELAAIKFIYEDEISSNPLQEISLKNRTVLRYFISKLNSPLSEREVFCYPKNLINNVKLDSLAYTPKPRVVKSVDEIAIVFEALTQLHEEGIKTMIVDIPRPIRSEAIINTPAYKKELQELLGLYESKLGIQHWKYDGQPIYLKDFRDYGHLNKGGRTIYSQWLLGEISKEF